ncbi:MAG: DUF4827 family protein [Paludibacteraceae bacterium]|nr:DUF4827 family protein [Paludibacteraceae bacterium]
MKRLFINLILMCSVTFISTSCNEEEGVRYADQLKEQEKLINEFIEREKIVVLENFPTDSVFQTNEYVLTESGLYFQLTKNGEGEDVKFGDKVQVRYKQKTLEKGAIIESFWTTQDDPRPKEVEYKVSMVSDCEAWHEAIGYMKKPGAECKIIVPGIIGFSVAQANLIPYYFEMKIKFHH